MFKFKLFKLGLLLGFIDFSTSKIQGVADKGDIESYV